MNYEESIGNEENGEIEEIKNKNLSTDRAKIEYLEPDPTPLAAYETEADAEEVQQTLERVSEELYAEEPPLQITQVNNEVRVFGKGGYKIIERTGEILEAPFFESRETAKNILENTVEKYNIERNQMIEEAGKV